MPHRAFCTSECLRLRLDWVVNGTEEALRCGGSTLVTVQTLIVLVAHAKLHQLLVIVASRLLPFLNEQCPEKMELDRRREHLHGFLQGKNGVFPSYPSGWHEQGEPGTCHSDVSAAQSRDAASPPSLHITPSSIFLTTQKRICELRRPLRVMSPHLIAARRPR